MALQYAGVGTIINQTFTCATGTRREIVDGIVACLTSNSPNAGWTVQSGGGTGDVVVSSPATAQSLNIWARIYDPGSGNAAEVYMRNSVGDRVAQANYLAIGAGKVYKVVAGGAYCHVMTAGSSASREYVGFGTLYVPSWQVVTGQCGWINGNGATASDGTVRGSFRTVLDLAGGSTTRRHSYLKSGTLINSVNSSSGPGYMALAIWRTETDGGYAWDDGTLHAVDPIMSINATYSVKGNAGGQLFDHMILMESIVADTVRTADGKQWIAITGSSATGTLYARIT